MADYSNRTDLQNPAAKIAATAAKGQAYGEAGKQIAAQQAVPMGASPSSIMPQGVAPGSMGALDRMTERPNEAITAGADFGSGTNMAQSGIPIAAPGFNDAIEELKVLYRQFPNDDLANLLSAMLNEGA
tara:strand:+ start:411 stop:797 length:387 start_codon:yes stop_codon:yes gene_type:complete